METGLMRFEMKCLYSDGLRGDVAGDFPNLSAAVQFAESQTVEGIGRKVVKCRRIDPEGGTAAIDFDRDTINKARPYPLRSDSVERLYARY